MNQDPTLWHAPAHTEAKQRLYRRYLEAWLPILSLGGFPRLLVVDAFAGPGQYSTGEDGSPIVALKSVLEHSLLPRILSRGTEISFLFVEARRDRYEHLRKLINDLQRPPQVRVNVRHDTFENVWNDTLTKLQTSGQDLEPALILIDPFGPTGYPMELVGRSALHPACEVLINFTYQSLNRWFISQPNKYAEVDQLFGGSEWRICLQANDSSELERCLVRTYQEALGRVGFKGVAFQMLNVHNQTQYYLIYGTKHHLGMRAFKDAAWSVAPDGQFKFSDLRNPQQIGFLKDVNEGITVQELAESLFQSRKGLPVSKEALVEFTDLHPTARIPHLTGALRKLENETPPRVLKVVRDDGRPRRRGSYPDSSIITFAP